MTKLNRKDRTVTRSFRISERALKALEEEARRQNIGVSALFNQQLIAFADFDRFLRRLGLVKMSSATFERILKAGQDEEIARAGREAGADTPRSIISLKYGALTLESILDHLTSVSEYSGQFEFGQVEKDGKKILTILHRLGPKGSKFYASYMDSMFAEAGISSKIVTSDHSLHIEILSGENQRPAF